MKSEELTDKAIDGTGVIVVNPMWAKALIDVQSRLSKAKMEVHKLEMALQTCRERCDKGEPWPEGAAEREVIGEIWDKQS